MRRPTARSYRHQATSGRRPSARAACCWSGARTRAAGVREHLPHRGHELLPCGQTATKVIICPYHAWTYSLSGSLPGRRGLPEGARLRLRRVGPGAAAGVRVARPGVRGRFRRCGRVARRRAGQAGRAGRAVRAGAAGDRRGAPLRRRRELEDAHRELPRVLPLPLHPPRAVPGQPAQERRELRLRRRLDRRLDGPARRHGDDVAVRLERRRARCAGWTRRACAPSSTSTSSRTCCSACTRTT